MQKNPEKLNRVFFATAAVRVENFSFALPSVNLTLEAHEIFGQGQAGGS
jgi:hypothetical protein